MKRMILTAIAVLFPSLTVWAQTSNTAPASSAPVAATHTQAASSSKHQQRHPQKHHSHQQPHHHSGVNAMR
jgi:hypothetical protein